jgi:glycosyltransferase involved in cell wall biosynthesis
MRGGERVLEVFAEIFPRGEIFTLLHLPGRVSPAIERLPIHVSPVSRLPGMARHYRSFLPLFPRAIERFDLSGYDLVLSSSHCVAKGVRPSCQRHISYCHTPMRYVWDRYDDYFGTDRPILTRIVARAMRRRLQDWDRASSQRVDAFIANSHHVARRIRDFYGREAEVIHPPVDVDRFAIAPRAEDYYLIVSALAPYKRIDIAIDAFVSTRWPLVIVGQGQDEDRLRRRSKGAANIRWLGWRSDDEVAQLFAHARALILPGEEDFGITPLESMASGRPVVALGRGGALETVIDARGGSAADPTGVCFDEPNAESLIGAVEYIEAHHRDFAPPALRRHAESFARHRFRDRIEAAIAAFLCSGFSCAPIPVRESRGSEPRLSKTS